MFYDLDDNPSCKPLPHNPFKACIAPRPIGWISSVSKDGINNLAPYSFFNGVASDPPQVMYCSSGHQPHGPKDTIRNIEETGEFVVNVTTWDLKDAMNASCAALSSDIDEFEIAGVTAAPCEKVNVPRVKQSPIAMECIKTQIIELESDHPESRNVMVIGRVVGLHVSPDVLTDGMIDPRKLNLISRLGYMDYATTGDLFSLARPNVK